LKLINGFVPGQTGAAAVDGCGAAAAAEVTAGGVACTAPQPCVNGRKKKIRPLGLCCKANLVVGRDGALEGGGGGGGHGVLVVEAQGPSESVSVLFNLTCVLKPLEVTKKKIYRSETIVIAKTRHKKAKDRAYSG